MGKMERYVGLLLKASGITEDDFWKLPFYQNGVTEAFYEFKSKMLADKAAHEMHLADPELRARAIMFIKSAGAESVHESQIFFDNKEGCQRFCVAVNKRIRDAGYMAKAIVRQSWLYDHVARSKGYENPYHLWVMFWDTDVSEHVIKSICKSAYGSR